jgi:hypothetical protein
MSALHSRFATFVLRPKPDPLTSTASYPKARMTSLKRKGDLTGSAEDLKRPKKDGSLNSFFGAPKPAAQSTLKLNSSAPEAAPIKFDKEKWVASLKDEQRQLLKLEIDTLDVSWLSHLKNDLVSPDFLSLKRFLQQEVDSKKKYSHHLRMCIAGMSQRPPKSYMTKLTFVWLGPDTLPCTQSKYWCLVKIHTTESIKRMGCHSPFGLPHLLLRPSSTSIKL